MDFMLLNKADYTVTDFDTRSEIVSKDKFFARAKKYICTDNETLLYRQELFFDILKNNALPDFLITLFDKLSEYAPLMKYQQTINTEDMLRCVLYPTVYIELVKFIYESLSFMINDVTSASIKRLYNLAKDDIDSDEYKRIERYYEKNTHKLGAVNSVTIGVNLNAVYQPIEAGILSFNQEPFKSGNLIDRIIRLDFEKDEFHCIAPLTVIDKKLGFQESQQVNYALLKAMDKALNSGLQHCSKHSLKYIKNKLATYFEFFESLSFVVDAIKRIKFFQEKNIPLCFPKISEDRSFNVVSLYNNALCRSKDKTDIVPHTVHLENNVCCYILTGPNSGGKTVFINSLAAAQYYFQLGMPIPAKEASLPICDAIFKVSAQEQANTNLVGRFEKECISLSEVLKCFTQNSLALIDEAFTSTSAPEAVPIAASFINQLCQIGGKCIFITHHHELCELLSSNTKFKNKTGYLHTEAKNKQRTYTIQKGMSESHSYAQDIAKKYGLIEE